jgi:type II secretory pathway predicted ATPase ExeA
MALLERVETVLPASDAPTLVVNSVIKNIRTMARRAFERRWIVAYSGRAGLGKSTAVDSLGAFLNFPHRILRCKQTTSLSSLVRSLALGEKAARWNKRTTHEYYQEAVAAANLETYLLVIDEADRLRADCFECLRDLWDDARLPVLLIGNEDLESIISSRHERLARRIGMRFSQAPLGREQLREVIEFLRFEVSDEEFDRLFAVCGGSPGWAEAVLNTRNEVAASHGVKPELKHLEGALKYFPTLSKA